MLLGASYMHLLERINGGKDLAQRKFGFNEDGLLNWFESVLGSGAGIPANDNYLFSNEYEGCK